LRPGAPFRWLLWHPKKVLAFDIRRKLLRQELQRLRHQQQSQRMRAGQRRPPGTIRLHLRRDRVFEDSFHQLRQWGGDDLKAKLVVKVCLPLIAGTVVLDVGCEMLPEYINFWILHSVLAKQS